MGDIGCLWDATIIIVFNVLGDSCPCVCVAEWVYFRPEFMSSTLCEYQITFCYVVIITQLWRPTMTLHVWYFPFFFTRLRYWHIFCYVLWCSAPLIQNLSKGFIFLVSWHLYVPHLWLVFRILILFLLLLQHFEQTTT